MIPLAIWWSTWKERNDRIFEGKVGAIDDFKLYLLRTLYSWSQVLIHGTKLTFSDFIDMTSVKSLRALWYFVMASFCT